MGCLSGIAKYLLFLFNFLIVICAIVFIVIGAIIINNENKGIARVTDFSIGGFAIAVGVIIFLIAFFGCCGAIQENGCMLTTYAVILVVLLILQIVLAALSFVALNNNDRKLDNAIIKAMGNIFDKYYSDPSSQKIVDNIQRDWECCGVEDSTYWLRQFIRPPPESCYSNSSLYLQGCAYSLKGIITSNIKIIGGVAIAFAVVELLGAIFACVVKNR